MPQMLSNPYSTSTASAPLSPNGPAIRQANLGPADLLSQLRGALKTLTQVVTLPNLAAHLAPQLAAALAPGAAPARIPSDAAGPSKTPGYPKSDSLPEVLAALGFVPVPTAFQPPTPQRDKIIHGPVKLEHQTAASNK